MRAFIAVDVPPGDPAAPTDRSTPPAPEHLTLRFFAELAPASLPAVIDAMSDVARGAVPFTLTIEGIGAFPSPRDPKVVWRGITQGRAAVMELAEALDRRLGELGFSTESRPFVPHLTWFRVRSDRDRVLAREVLATGAVPPPRSFRVDAFVLKESALTREGAVHRPVARVGLGPPARTA